VSKSGSDITIVISLSYRGYIGFRTAIDAYLYVAASPTFLGLPGFLVNTRTLRPYPKHRAVSSHALCFIKHTQAVLVPKCCALLPVRRSVYRRCLKATRSEIFEPADVTRGATWTLRYCCKIRTGGEKWKIQPLNHPPVFFPQANPRTPRRHGRKRSQPESRGTIRRKKIKQASFRGAFPDAPAIRPTRVFPAASRISPEKNAVQGTLLAGTGLLGAKRPRPCNLMV
jgi:hypothetical protein